jgi:hypothetical protein
MSRNWCDGADTATVSSVRIVPGPMGMGDWVVVANVMEPVQGFNAMLNPETATYAGPGTTGWDLDAYDPYLYEDTWDQTSWMVLLNVQGYDQNLLATGEDHELFAVQSGGDSVNDKPCIVKNDSTLSDADWNYIAYASDDFCQASNNPADFTGDQDPGAGFGPNRIWLAYDDMTGMWSVHGTWDTAVGGMEAGVGYSNFDMVGAGEVLQAAGWDAYDSSMGGIQGWSMSGDGLEAGEGELFTFDYTGAGAPCLTNNTRGRMGTYFYSNDTNEYIEGLKSPDWCEGPDEALTSLKVVAGPQNLGDWMVVAHTNQAFLDVQVRLTGDYSGWGGPGPAVTAQGWTAQESDPSVFRAHFNMNDALPAGEDHHMFYGWYSEKPCIERGDDTYILDDMYTSMDIVSDDFCGGSSGGAGNPSDYIGAMDPGDGYGPNRMWLSYDDMSGEWSVNGKWDRSLITVATMVVGSQMAYPGIGLAPVEMVWNFDHTTDPMMGEGFMTSNNGETGTTLTAGEGELFRFMYGSGVPCLVGYYDDWAMDATYFQDEMWMQLEVQSPDFCE